MKYTWALIATLGLSLIGSPQAQAEGVQLLKKQEGPWKAACYKDTGVDAPYCRIMIINIFGASKKSTNFVQFGPAFDRGRMGFVFASYHGFAPESTVKVKIDSNETHVLQTTQTNHTIAPTDMSTEISDQMKNGKAITVEFKLSSGIDKALDFSLAGYKKLLPEVQKVMDGKS